MSEAGTSVRGATAVRSRRHKVVPAATLTETTTQSMKAVTRESQTDVLLLVRGYSQLSDWAGM